MVTLIDKVKQLFLIPETTLVTTRMIADYYEVDVDAIKKCYQRNIEEIKQDGTQVIRSCKQFWQGHVVPPKIQTRQGGAMLYYDNGLEIDIPVVNIRVFTKRACLRIGMLLRDSTVAKEVRTQLLNVFTAYHFGNVSAFAFVVGFIVCFVK